MAAEIIKYLSSQYMTTIEEDEELLEKTVKPESTSALLLKISHKNILELHIHDLMVYVYSPLEGEIPERTGQVLLKLARPDQ